MATVPHHVPRAVSLDLVVRISLSADVITVAMVAAREAISRCDRPVGVLDQTKEGRHESGEADEEIVFVDSVEAENAGTSWVGRLSETNPTDRRPPWESEFDPSTDNWF